MPSPEAMKILISGQREMAKGADEFAAMAADERYPKLWRKRYAVLAKSHRRDADEMASTLASLGVGNADS